MATNITMNYYNGSSYTELYPSTSASQILSGTLPVNRGGTGVSSLDDLKKLGFDILYNTIEIQTGKYIGDGNTKSLEINCDYNAHSDNLLLFAITYEGSKDGYDSLVNPVNYNSDYNHSIWFINSYYEYSYGDIENTGVSLDRNNNGYILNYTNEGIISLSMSLIGNGNLSTTFNISGIKYYWWGLFSKR